VTFRAARAFTSSMDENELTRRMRAIGEQPVPDTTRNLHLHRMAGVAATPTKRFGRFAVAAAAVVGFMAGSTGLAMAGALPAPAQDVAHDVLSTVNLEVPKGKEGKRGPCVSAIAKDTSLTEEQKDAKKEAECPKGPFGPPAHAGQGGASGDNPGKGRADAAKGGDGCRGKPPWAGRDDLTEAQTDAMAAERNAACGRGGNGAPEASDAPEEQAPAPEQSPAPAPEAPPAEETPVEPEAETVEPEAEVVEPAPTEEPAPEGTETPTDDGQG
jgi:hypothetical protein